MVCLHADFGKYSVIMVNLNIDNILSILHYIYSNERLTISVRLLGRKLCLRRTALSALVFPVNLKFEIIFKSNFTKFQIIYSQSCEQGLRFFRGLKRWQVSIRWYRRTSSPLRFVICCDSNSYTKNVSYHKYIDKY